MRKALFLHTEADKDLIVGFALQLSDDPTDIETLAFNAVPRSNLPYLQRNGV